MKVIYHRVKAYSDGHILNYIFCWTYLEQKKQKLLYVNNIGFYEILISLMNMSYHG